MSKKKKKRNTKKKKNIRNRRFAKKEYNNNEREVIENYIKTCYGPFNWVLHDSSPNQKLHVDMYIIEPDEYKPYWKIVTGGMGAHKMRIPSGYEEIIPNRCELVLAVEPSWNLVDEDTDFNPIRDINLKNPKDKFPFEIVQSLSLLPIMDNTFLSTGHTIDLRRIEGTNIQGALILPMQDTFRDDVFDRESFCELPNGETVVFYQIVPLTKKEMNYWLEGDAEKRDELIPKLTYVAQSNRKSVV